MTKYENRQKWFLSKIGSTVYRTETKCKCKICKHGYEKGVYIVDDFHARYLFDAELEGFAKYFGSIEERNEFEKVNQ